MAYFNDDYNSELDLLHPENHLFETWGEQATDFIEIPATSEDPLAITKTKLVPRDYAMDPINGGQFLELAQFNGLFKTLTKELKKQLIYSGLLPYNAAEQADTGGYPLDAVVSILYDDITGILYTPDAIDNLPAKANLTTSQRRAKAQRLLVRSLIPNNTDSPLERNNLFKTWEIMDGKMFGETRDFIINTADDSFPPPPGYLDLAPPTRPSYSLEDYPRVAVALKAAGGNCGYFKQAGTDRFTIDHLGGLFPRVFNNNSTRDDRHYTPRDPGRSFSEIQEDAMGVITGLVMIAAYDYQGSSSYGDHINRLIPMRGWVPFNSLPKHIIDDPKYAFLKDIDSVNAFKPITIQTNYSNSSESYQRRGFYSYEISKSNQSILSATYNALMLDTSDHPKTAHEVRPKNFCVKKYVKV